ncbi:MAG: hypothetical protein Q9M36_15650 [Sulfurovum sp.]|nr:hypothetical protein [Sulfurovum sp.]
MVYFKCALLLGGWGGCHFLLEFYTYKLQNIDKSSSEYMKARQEKHIILLQRFKFPVETYSKKLPKNKRPITDTNKPTIFQLGLKKYKKNDVLEISYSPFSIEDIGYNTYFGDRLTLLETQLELKKNNISLIKLDLIKIRRLKTNTFAKMKMSIF